MQGTDLFCLFTTSLFRTSSQIARGIIKAGKRETGAHGNELQLLIGFPVPSS